MDSSGYSFDFVPSWAADVATVVEGDAVDSNGKRAPRRRTVCTELTTAHEYRRAFSEVSLLEAMCYVPLRNGVSYHFFTGGDVDSLSYLKIVLNHHSLDHLLLSTWCANAEDILQLTRWYEEGRIGAIDMYVSEIFPNSYKVEYLMINEFYRQHPTAGGVTVFHNHCKVFAGCCRAADFYFAIESSANVNTNPRTEQGVITCDRGLYEFYCRCFADIREQHNGERDAKDTTIKKGRQ